ncbi:COG3650 family protein [Paracoccus zhejiangensis]|uniref:Uncharacterized protein n=1 Tax=Paracoccus zhejiangensis TaxID=1077935 RepID=A0A2H5F2U3_9RHOB|nr:hypothetical protein [Paracoccus zhejiangensis]AUH65865.1 hypothetical protein CX676_18280 [Paracoccus zhejiangensis]
MKLRLAALAVLPLALAACDDQAMTDLQSSLGMKPEVAEQPATPSGPPAVSPLEQAIEVEGGEHVASATANSETLNTVAFVARGNEPFWTVEASGERAVYKTPENQKGRTVTVRRLTFAQGVEFVGTLDGSAFALTVRGTDCVDDMSGEKFPMSATLKIGGRTNNGCAAPAAAAATETTAAPQG